MESCNSCGGIVILVNASHLKAEPEARPELHLHVSQSKNYEMGREEGGMEDGREGEREEYLFS